MRDAGFVAAAVSLAMIWSHVGEAAAEDGQATPADAASRPSGPGPDGDEDELPRFAVGGQAGFGMVSADGASTLITHWLLQTDLRTFLDEDSPRPDRDAFLVRFAGVRVDAMLARRFRAQLFANLAENRLILLDAWVEIELASWLRLRAGKFAYPISQERLTPQIALPFVSTSVAAMMLPSRDTGLHLLGGLPDGLLSWNLALTNGAAVGGSGDGDTNSQKEVIGRLFARPLARTGVESLAQLGVGVGASRGRHTGTPESPQLPILSTYGGLNFFTYAPTAVASGIARRIVPHLTWGYGPVSLYTDAVWARDRVNGIDVSSRALSAIATAVLTGEDAAPLAFIVPARPLDLAAGRIGAVVLVGGAGEVEIGREAFPELADPLVAMRRMRVYGGGVNWYPTSGVAVLLSYGHHTFASARGVPARADENTVVVRLQLVL